MQGLRETLNVPGAPTREHHDMASVQWGKLLLNLNNALNALAGVPLATQLADRRWRLILAAQIREGLRVLKAAGVRPARIEAVPPGLIPRILRLPNWLFRRVAARMLAIDPQARSSMWEDLERRRPTEIDDLQGAILALGKKSGTRDADDGARDAAHQAGRGCKVRLARADASAGALRARMISMGLGAPGQGDGHGRGCHRGGRRACGPRRRRRAGRRRRARSFCSTRRASSRSAGRPSGRSAA